ncbi:MAG: fimbrillin family protein [Rikenellaceae bacterium]
MKMNYIKSLAIAFAAVVATGCSDGVSDTPWYDAEGALPLNVTRSGVAAEAYSPASGTVLELKNFLTSDLSLSSGATTATYTYNGTSWSTTDQLTYPKEASELYVAAYIKSGDNTSFNSFSMGEDATIDQSAGLDSFDYLYAQGTIDLSNSALNLSLSHIMAKVNVNVVLEAESLEAVTASVKNIATGATRTDEGSQWVSTISTASVTPLQTTASNVVTLSLLMPAQEWSQELSFEMGDVNFTTAGDGYTVESGKEYTFTIYAGYSDQITMDSDPTVSTFSTAVTATAPEAIDTRDWDGISATAFAGSGTEEDPYQISTAANLAYLSQSVADGTGKNGYRGTYFVLMGDMSLNNYEWTPIGSSEVEFEGSFDGCGYTISDMTITKMSGTTAGLFGMTNNAKNFSNYIKNLTIDRATINIATDVAIPTVGFLAGCIARATDVTASVTIENCIVSNSTLTFSTTDSATHYIGGLSGDAGESAPVHFAGCKIVNSSLESGALMGGIVARMQYGLMQGCENDGTTIHTSVKSAGGLCAFLSLAGRTVSKGDATIVGCKSSGTISRSSSGSNYITGGIVSNCYGRVIASISDTEILLPKDSGYTGAIVGQTLANTKINGGLSPNVVAMMFNSYTTITTLDAIGKELASAAASDSDVNGVYARVSSFAAVCEDLNVVLQDVEDNPATYFYSDEAGLDVDNVAYVANYLFDADANIIKVE